MWPEALQQQDQRRDPAALDLARPTHAHRWCRPHRLRLDRSRPVRLQALLRSPTTTLSLDALPVKHENKRDVPRWCGARTACSCPDAMFVAQVKRIHEYKRQLLACLRSSRTTWRSSAAAAPVDAPRVHLRRQGGARLRHGQAAHPLLNDVASVVNADPDGARPPAGGLRAQLRRLAGRGIIPPPSSRCRSRRRARRRPGTSNMKLR
jgi:hypothetical protein